MELPENTGLNEHAIKLVEGKQPLYGPIYALSPVELKATTPPAKADPPKSDQSEASDKVRKDRKKKWQKKKQERKEVSSEGNLQAIGSNAVASEKKKSNQNRGQNRGQQNLSQVTYWNCDKKGHYSTNCTEPPKVKK